MFYIVIWLQLLAVEDFLVITWIKKFLNMISILLCDIFCFWLYWFLESSCELWIFLALISNTISIPVIYPTLDGIVVKSVPEQRSQPFWDDSPPDARPIIYPPPHHRPTRIPHASCSSQNYRFQHTLVYFMGYTVHTSARWYLGSAIHFSFRDSGKCDACYYRWNEWPSLGSPSFSQVSAVGACPGCSSSSASSRPRSAQSPAVGQPWSLPAGGTAPEWSAPTPPGSAPTAGLGL